MTIGGFLLSVFATAGHNLNGVALMELDVIEGQEVTAAIVGKVFFIADNLYEGIVNKIAVVADSGVALQSESLFGEYLTSTPYTAGSLMISLC